MCLLLKTILYCRNGFILVGSDQSNPSCIRLLKNKILIRNLFIVQRVTERHSIKLLELLAGEKKNVIYGLFTKIRFTHINFISEVLTFIYDVHCLTIRLIFYLSF